MTSGWATLLIVDLQSQTAASWCSSAFWLKEHDDKKQVKALCFINSIIVISGLHLHFFLSNYILKSPSWCKIKYTSHIKKATH